MRVLASVPAADPIIYHKHIFNTDGFEYEVLKFLHRSFEIINVLRCSSLDKFLSKKQKDV